MGSTRAKALVNFSEHRLANGLRVILSEDHSAPTVSVSLAYDVGSRDERPGESGFAHLFEHMMFQGSENVGKGEHFLLIQNNGGSMNGTTSSERTNYYQTLPANQLDLALFLEADRMKSLSVTAANFENQRATVIEERKQNYDNRPYGRSSELLPELVFANFANAHSTIGSLADLEAFTFSQALAFHGAYYTPNNCVLALVGDVDPVHALARVEHYFGDIPSGTRPPAPDVAEPEPSTEKRETFVDPLARLARVDIACAIPAANSPDFQALQLLTMVLSGGHSSRLYQEIVLKQEALSAGAFAQERRGPGMLVVAAFGPDAAQAESALLREIERVRSAPVEAWELEKAQLTLRRQVSQQLLSTVTRANLLAIYAVFYDDPGFINRRLELFDQVTVEDLHRVARQYLAPPRRRTLLTLPPAQEKAA
ncbi:MAG: insulinase family protein [Bryobacteraceae bacterium]|nr:insulinase family protein [Bryobacteraceae bacterium]